MINYVNKNVCYTCIIGQYDTLKDPDYITVGWDYICYTDNPNLTSTKWDIRLIPDNIRGLDNSRQNRYIKILPHILFPEYDFSIYVDGSMKPIGDLNMMKQELFSDDHIPLYLMPHNKRNCTYQEFFACSKQNKDDQNILEMQCRKYHEEGFPYDFGLSHNCILFRYHNNPNCIKIMETLLDQIVNYSLRDQLSMMYSIWITNNMSNFLFTNREMVKKYFNLDKSWLHNIKQKNDLIKKYKEYKDFISKYEHSNLHMHS